MNPIPVLPAETSKQSASGSQADRSSASSDGSSGFGPILLAASAPSTPDPASPQTAADSRTGRPQRQDSKQQAHAGPGQGQAPSADGNVAAAAIYASTLAAASSAEARTAASREATLAARNGIDSRGAIDTTAVTTETTGASAAAPEAAVGQVAAATGSIASAPSEPAAGAFRSILAGQAQVQSSPTSTAQVQSNPTGTAAETDSNATAGTPTGSPIAGDAARTAAQALHDAAAAATDRSGQDPASDFNTAALAATAASVIGKDGKAIAQAAGSALPASATASTGDAPSGAGTTAAILSPDAASAGGASAAVGFAAPPPYATEARVSVSTPVGQPQFAQELSQHIVVMTRGGVQSAQISLEPAGLGPVGVSIQVNGHAATLAFTAAHEATRSALQDALPRLREMFASSGMQLSDATVGGRSQSDWSGPSQSPVWGQAEQGVQAGLVAAPESTATASLAAARLVDTYA